MPNSPAKAEATGQDISFIFEGESYTVRPALEWELDAMEAYEEGRLVACIKLVVGDAQYQKFKLAGAKRTLGDLDRFFSALQDAAGTPNS